MLSWLACRGAFLPSFEKFEITDSNQRQAFIVNGGSYVLPNMLYQSPWYHWSSSVVADDRNDAWTFVGTGYIYLGNRSFAYAVRCVGR